MASRPLGYFLYQYLYLLFLLQLHNSSAQDVVKAAYWFPASEFPVSDIDSTLFTHLICAFANLDTQTNQLVISSANTPSFSSFTKTVQLKNPSVKTLLSIGGGNVASETFASMASQSSSRKTFIDSSIKLARSYDFHGLDLDWEHQTMTSEMTFLNLLLDEWRAAVDTEATDSGLPKLILTAAVPFTPLINSIVYPTASLSRNLDWINVMAYDFYAPDRASASGATHSHAALYDSSSDVSASYGIEKWIEGGVSSKKIVIGFPFYGYAWLLTNPNNHGLLAPANGPDLSVGGSDGSIGYNKIKMLIIGQKGATTVFNDTIVADYCYVGTSWIGYDDVQTISTKISYAKGKGLLGYFAWHVGSDDSWVLSKQASQTWGSGA